VWDDLLRDARTDPTARCVPQGPGVYEVKYSDQDERLTIGMASRLRMMWYDVP
jgi:hypothetical protein